MDAFLMDKSIKEITGFQKVYDAITRYSKYKFVMLLQPAQSIPPNIYTSSSRLAESWQSLNFTGSP